MSSKVKTELVCYLLDREAEYCARERENALLIRDRIKEGSLHRSKDDALYSPEHYEGRAEGYNEAIGRLFLLRDLIKD